MDVFRGRSTNICCSANRRPGSNSTLNLERFHIHYFVVGLFYDYLLIPLVVMNILNVL
jgi:hypothetical protein